MLNLRESAGYFGLENTYYILPQEQKLFNIGESFCRSSERTQRGMVGDRDAAWAKDCVLFDASEEAEMQPNLVYNLTHHKREEVRSGRVKVYQ